MSPVKQLALLGALLLLLPLPAGATPPSIGAQKITVYPTGSQACGAVPCIWADASLGKLKFRDASGVDLLMGEANRFTVAASDPGAPVFGQCIANSSAQKIRCYQNGQWVSWGDGGTASAIGFAAVKTALTAASSSVGFNAQRLTGVADPSSAQDAATKNYVDAVRLYHFHGAAGSATGTQYLGAAGTSSAAASPVPLFTAPETLAVQKVACVFGTAPGGMVTDTVTVVSKPSGGSWGDLATTCGVTGSATTCTGAATAPLAPYDLVGVKLVRDALSVSAAFDCEVWVTK